MEENGEKLFEKVLKTSKEWGSDENMMYVVGATKAEMLTEIKALRANNRELLDQRYVLMQVEPMTAVAGRYAHRMALELECVLADRPGYYDKAMQVLSEYRSAMNAIHEQHSPTRMGEPLMHNAI